MNGLSSVRFGLLLHYFLDHAHMMGSDLVTEPISTQENHDQLRSTRAHRACKADLITPSHQEAEWWEMQGTAVNGTLKGCLEKGL